jgi:hypothetical protein
MSRCKAFFCSPLLAAFGVPLSVFRGGRAVSRQNIAVRPNHSLKRRANSAPSGPLHFCGLSYVPRACWHTVGSRLAQTLGRTERKFQTACCLVNFSPPAAAQVEDPARKGRSQIRSALSNTVICERCEFSRRNLEELVRGASRRALRRIVSQLSRPRAANGKAAAVRLPRRVCEREIHSTPIHQFTQCRGVVQMHLGAASRRSGLVLSRHQAFSCRFSVAAEPSRGKKSRCGLTIRSSGEPTARRLARAAPLAYPAPRGPAVTLLSPA